VNVEQDQFRLALARQFNAFCALPGSADLMAKRLQQIHHQLQVGGIIFDD
jgi:hypothetical protein